MRSLGFAIAAMIALAAAPASALTFSLGGANTTLAAGSALTKTVDGVTLTARAYSFTATPNAFKTSAVGAQAATVLSGLTPQRIRREATGLGVCPPGEAGNQCNQ